MTTTSIKSVCPYCGVGCGIVMQVQDNTVVKVIGDKHHPTNFGRLCTKGTTCGQAIAVPGRLTHAYTRPSRDQEPVRTGIDQAIDTTALRLRELLDRHGPQALAFYVSGQMSLEAQYLANKLAKGFVRTPHIESNSRLCMASAGSGYKLSLGSDGPPGSYQDFDHADLFFVIGANMADCHPILFLRMMDRVKAGARLIVVDPRRSATADKAGLFLQIKPGTDLALLNGLLHLLVKNGHTDPAFIAAFTEGWEAMPEFLEDYAPDTVAAITGLAEADIREAAQWIGNAAQWMSCWTMGLNQSTHGTWSTNALCNLHLATGALCRPGSGPFSLTGQPNAMGGREMGYMGPGLPGQRSLLVEADRAFIEDLWQIPPDHLPRSAGNGTVAMFEQMRAGQIKACWIICTNPVASVPNRQTVIDALQSAELVITQDAYLDTETNRYADILLPGALWAEAQGVMINSERNLTLMQKAVEPPGDTLADWQIIARVACAMGFAESFSYASAAEVFEEIKRAWNPKTGYDIRGASYARLREAPLQWPCAAADSAERNPIRYLNNGISQTLARDACGQAPALVFPTDSGKAHFLPRPHMDPAQMPDEAFPFVLNTGRLQHQWHTLTKTGKVATLNKLNPGPFVEIHPQDAAALAIKDKDPVEIRSSRGHAVLPAVVTDRVRPGNCFAPFHWNDVFGDDLAINAVTSDAVDPLSLQPELKFCAVALRRLALIGHQTLEDVSPQAATEPADITLLWASQTGNAQALAEGVAQQLRDAGRSVELSAMNDFTVARLARIRELVLISSTFGDGDAPDNGAVFWKALLADAPPLPSLRYGVLALGDPNYDQFCHHGRQLDRRLHELGAIRLLDRVDCDTDYTAPASAWMGQLRQCLGLAVAPAPSACAGEASEPNKARPYAARLVINRLLNQQSEEKETRLFALDLADSGIRYEAGDALGVLPRNCPQLVDELLQRTRLKPDTSVNLPTAGEMPLYQALSAHFEIARPSHEALSFIAERSGQPQLKHLLGEHDKAALKDWLWGRQLADVLSAFPVDCSAEELLGLLKPLQPRLYSIASSAKAHPDQVHLTVSAVRYGNRKGVSSTFLADRAEDAEVPIFVQPSRHFRVPVDGDVPIIMIGPGTGVAPFRGFLQERRARGDKGRNWLFFGEQRRRTDFYYEDELTGYQADGLLDHLSLAFSRDQPEKVYVQDRMREHGAELWAWLQEGAQLYICGDASRMAKDVDRVLHEVVAQHGGMGEDGAQAYVAGMLRAKRYLRDVY
ncbi:bifunctional nitrate reductase/sulfite reductase flavoprotein subunit alpha [Pseudomonas sp. dw_358]|uniref:bifunctional nitrate reductase/sulfite reductase flavoprotein subunit alpha n=1 Tax=Pseudomonas sp. dw_358 TaxID=2720083 RepID=UPI001BD49A17|nr:bifunctional nitrate reductase/sulfite reductase flavoprotein subunit alpha [Pseudomonas sp. dw_358]